MKLTIEPPDPQPLLAIWLKLPRSQEHLNVFQAESENYKLEHRGDHIAELAGDTLTITPVVSPPPIRLSLIVGDCLTNCHAALDYAMRAIAVRHVDPTFDVEMPEDRRIASFRTRPREVEDQINYFESKKVPAAVVGMIRSANPAGRPTLSVLKTLVNTDKHHFLILTAPIVSAARVVTFVNEPRMGMVQGKSIAAGVELRLSAGGKTAHGLRQTWAPRCRP